MRIEHKSKSDHGMGTNVILEHKLSNCQKVYTTYSHLASIDKKVAAGKSVKRGARVGKIGGSGYGSDAWWGTHLHFEVKAAAVTGNPYPANECKKQNVCWGYLKKQPDAYGYFDPKQFIGK